MSKTTKEIISDAIEKGIVNNIKRNGESVYYEIMSTPSYRTDLVWYSQDEVDRLNRLINDLKNGQDHMNEMFIEQRKDELEQLKEELKLCISEFNNNSVSNHIRIDKVFAKLG
jgi:hypothetical protein